MKGGAGSFLACHARIEGLAFASPNQGVKRPGGGAHRLRVEPESKATDQKEGER